MGVLNGTAATNNVALYKCPPGGSWANVTSSGLPSGTDVQITAIGTQLYTAWGSSISGDALLAKWGAGGVSQVLTPGYVVTSWALKNNGSIALAVPKVPAAASVALYMNNGSGWTATSLGPIIGAPQTPADIAWSAALGLWLMVVTTPAPASVFYTSPDGVTWTLQGGLSSTDPVVALASFGGCWIAATYNSTTHTSKLIYSYDAISWYGTPVAMYAAGASAPKLAVSAAQMALLLSSTSGVASPFRFSAAAGLPDVALT